MMLHEDYEGIGAYLYELDDTLDPGLGAKIIAAMGLHVPIDLRPEIEECASPCRKRTNSPQRRLFVLHFSEALKFELRERASR
jgi:hypothetical protein